MAEVRLPGNAIDPQGADIVAPAVGVLQELHLLPTADDLKDAGKASAAFRGPPQSVAVIEANATALSKWWAAGLGAAVASGWASVANFWNDIGGDSGPVQTAISQRMFMLAVAIASAAAILAIGYILGSDVRGRAAGAAATIAARSNVAQTVLQVAKGRVIEEYAALTFMEIQPRAVKYLTRGGDDESGWVAIALQSKPDGSDRKYLVVKGNSDAWAATSELQFITN